jgi:pimeloyl-ACP methyl ester carboxylesterase
MSAPSYTSKFAQVNGIRLHFLDWGGNGPVMCFLAGLGCTAHIYSEFASRFIGSHRVIALTRRGHGESDCPEDGYDADTLTEDLRQLLDSLSIDRVTLVGHSLANVELGHFTSLYPDHVLNLVFLDAAYDGPRYKPLVDNDPLKDVKPPEEEALTFDEYVAQGKRARPDLAAIWGPLLYEEVKHTIRTTPEGKVVDRMPAAVAQALMDTYLAYSHRDSHIRAPVLSIYAIHEDYANYSPDYLTLEQRALQAKYIREMEVPYQRECIDEFRRLVPHARIVEIPRGHHYCFIKHADLVFDEAARFLAQAP